MAVHAHLRRGNIRMRRRLHKAMAIPAIQTQLPRMNLVRKRHRLRWLVADFRVFGRPKIPNGPDRSGRKRAQHKKDFKRNEIRAAWKNLWHRSGEAGVTVDGEVQKFRCSGRALSVSSGGQDWVNAES